MRASPAPLDPGLVERVVEALGLSALPEPDAAGLRALYGAWCQRVPFDNIRKLVHIRAQDPAPLPGDDATDFFDAWLAHGTGGTCWAGNGALCALLEATGFDARRGVCTMVFAGEVPPNHGTVSVELGGERWLVDASILHGEPMRLEARDETRVVHPAWGIRCAQKDGRFHVRWRIFHLPGGLDCRIESLSSDAGEFQERHEATRAWSPFNYQLSARLNRGDRVIGAGFGALGAIDASGVVTMDPTDDASRRKFLLEEIGVSEAMVSRLPPDVAMPPPPDSRTAAALERAAKKEA